MFWGFLKYAQRIQTTLYQAEGRAVAFDLARPGMLTYLWVNVSDVLSKDLSALVKGLIVKLINH